ncbi:MAG: glycosyltransferase [Chloroflexi bacterium]|nr:glycosyltransferase [Chloroflexota bacterium]
MRIVLFTDTFLPKVDGIVTVIRLLLEHLQARGHTVMVVCPDLGPVDEYAGAQVVRVPGIPFWAYPGLKLSWPGYLTYRKVRTFKPDVGHFIHAGFTGGSGMFMMLAMNTPRVVSFHIDYERLAPQFGFAWAWPAGAWLGRVMFNRADLLIAPAAHMVGRIREQGVRPPIVVWGRGVDTTRFHPRCRSAAMRTRLGGDDTSTLLLYVGRLSEEKRLRDLRAVLGSTPDVRLALVGGWAGARRSGSVFSRLSGYVHRRPARRRPERRLRKLRHICVSVAHGDLRPRRGRGDGVRASCRGREGWRRAGDGRIRRDRVHIRHWRYRGARHGGARAGRGRRRPCADGRRGPRMGRSQYMGRQDGSSYPVL